MTSRSNITNRVVDYCAQECAWQQSGEMSVARMVAAWRYCMRRRNRMPRLDDILTLGRIVEPGRNPNGLRHVGVRVGWDVKMDWRDVPRALDHLLTSLGTYEIGEDGIDENHGSPGQWADEWFRQFEEIHPFVDGNGRTGTLLWNWLNGTLDKPDHVPNLWDDPRRYEGAPR